jgi:hypothetical protein
MNLPLPPKNPDRSYSFIAGMAIDGDGSPRVYGPKGIKPDPLDYLENAGGPGNWFGVVTDTGKPNGKPVVQNQFDPCPGFYVSPTSYKHPKFDRKNPLAYVNSEAVIYIVLPSHWRKEAQGVVLGCKAEVRDVKTGKNSLAVVADFGPKAKCGEASIACAQFFGVPSSPKNGGTDEKRFRYTFFPGVAGAGFELQPM